MDNKYEAVLKLLLETVKDNMPSEGRREDEYKIPIGISNRHVHLSQVDFNTLFGEEYQLTRVKDLTQPGQFACKETVTICGPKGAIEKIRILGPIRSKTQVEVLKGDSFKLGTVPQIRMSGDLHGTSGITIVGPKGSIQIKEGLIVAQRHIHMTPGDAQHFDVHDGQIVSIQVDGPRGGIYNNVVIRANDASALECHVDTEEANAMNLNNVSKITIIK